MIKSKVKIEFICVCGAKYPKMYGRCHICGKFNTISEIEGAPKVYRLPKVSLKRKEQNKLPDVDKDILDKWFDARIIEAKKICKCENCGKDVMNQLNSNEVWVSRASISHIFPKKKTTGGYPSVSCHDLNWTLMCLDCHTLYGSTWENAKSMPIWEHICLKAKIFSHLITEPRSKLPTELFID